MSVINKMLKDLDRRNATPEGLLATDGMASDLGEPRSGADRPNRSQFFWWIMSGLMVVAIAWLAWVMWELTPRPVVNELALRRAPRGVEAANGSPVAAPGFFTSGESRAIGARSLASSRPDMLRLATEITTPLRPRPEYSSPNAAPGGANPLPPVNPAPAQAVRQSVSPLTPPSGTTPPTASSTAPGERSSVTDPSGDRIVKRPTAAARDQAEVEYRRSAVLIGQGRAHEAMDGLRNTLALDPGHETARQALVSLALEQRRMDEAYGVLAQGLDLNPGNSTFAMLLARIMVERKDFGGALDLLKKHASSAARNADYHAFAAALMQRMGRHDEAMAEYRMALQLNPRFAPWWIGLGISQEATGRGKDAVLSYGKARESGAAGDLLGYVEQRLKQLQ